MRLKDKVVLVTGGSKGIGKAICQKLLDEGAIVVYFARNKGDFSSENIEFVQVDLTCLNSMKKAVEFVISKYKRIDVLVNNVGMIQDGLVQKMTEEMWDNVIDLNLKSVFLLTKEVIPLMLEQNEGSIINISSIVGRFGNIGQTNYAASKAGLIAMTQTWAKELTRKGANIRTNAVAPGYIMTEMMETVPDKVLDSIKAKNPLKRLGTPEEVANVVVFLASEEASFINGHTLCVDGGMTL